MPRPTKPEKDRLTDLIAARFTKRDKKRIVKAAGGPKHVPGFIRRVVLQAVAQGESPEPPHSP